MSKKFSAGWHMKRILKTLISFALIIAVTITCVPIVRCNAVSTSAYAYALYCVNTGEFLVSSNGDVQLPMASTTKIMTAILGIEALQAADEEMVVTMTPDMYAEGSSMYLAANDKILMSDLVGGMLMVSGNDAANAIALTVGGSFDGFSKLMNKKAEEIGLKNSGFVTPSGLDADGHYTTACDLAKLMAYCMENTLFRQIDGEQSITVNFISPENKTETYYNENRLLREYEYCVAGKTGYTSLAGRTLVSCAEKDGIRLVAVTLNDRDDWNDHKRLFDYGFENLSMEQLDVSFDDLSIPIAGGTKQTLNLAVGEQPSICVSDFSTNEVEISYELPRFVYAPIAEGESIGKVTYYHDGIFLGQSDVTSAETVAYKEIPTSFTENLISFFKTLFV